MMRFERACRLTLTGFGLVLLGLLLGWPGAAVAERMAGADPILIGRSGEVSPGVVVETAAPVGQPPGYACFVRQIGAFARERARVRAAFDRVHAGGPVEVGDRAGLVLGDRASGSGRPRTPSADNAPATPAQPASGSRERNVALAAGMFDAAAQVLETAELPSLPEGGDSGDLAARDYELVGQLALACGTAFEFIASDSVEDLPLPPALVKKMLVLVKRTEEVAAKFDGQEGDDAAWRQRATETVTALKALGAEIKQVRASLLPPSVDNEPLMKAAGRLIVAQSLLEGCDTQGKGKAPYWQRTATLMGLFARQAAAVLQPLIDQANGLPAALVQGLPPLCEQLKALDAAPPAAPDVKTAREEITRRKKAFAAATRAIEGLLEAQSEAIFGS